ncbi:MAG: SlyX family protein [Opitutales bacterium]|nr:SlyX family protein [Opitutales bacterium]|tara:strand:+ start:176 stop:376 length:201 start_codon:yes stop_codon:yes gene_type:complete
MSELSIDRLESKITFLERHVEQQDRVILELRNLLDNTRKQIDTLKKAMDDVEAPQTDTIDEKPPHY